jgi:hypothetical protein
MRLLADDHAASYLGRHASRAGGLREQAPGAPDRRGKNQISKENQPMSKTGAAVAVYATHDEADAAIKSLQKSGFEMKKLSIVGKDFHTEEHAVGYYNTGDRVRFWGKTGAFWGGLAGILFSSAFLVIPVVGHIIVLGPLVSSIIGGLEGAAVVGSTSALFGALVGLGIPKDSVIQYENDVKAGKFLVLAQGTPEEVARAKDVLAASKPATMAVHST